MSHEEISEIQAEGEHVISVVAPEWLEAFRENSHKTIDGPDGRPVTVGDFMAVCGSSIRTYVKTLEGIRSRDEKFAALASRAPVFEQRLRDGLFAHLGPVLGIEAPEQ